MPLARRGAFCWRLLQRVNRCVAFAFAFGSAFAFASASIKLELVKRCVAISGN